ncbi:MAG: metallophosphoesterase family protein [Pseudomonadaceae bacterium]
MLRIGLISDTHDLLRPQALAALKGCDHLIHAGDITTSAVLRELELIAPVTAVRGNNDRDTWAQALPETQVVEFAGQRIFVIHDLAQLQEYPPPADVRVVVCGHSHKPSVTELDGVLYVNPGSAGRRRFKLPVAVAELLVDGEGVSARIIELEVPPAARRTR